MTIPPTHFRFWLLPVVITICMAACSLVYQLVLAQTLTALFGGTVLRYSVTIGLYLLGLGLGVWWLDRIPVRHTPQRFFYSQLCLSLCGSLGFLSLILVSIWQYDLTLLVLLYAHALILLIGFLSGLELPLMNELNQQRFTQTLSFDYWGALIGCLCFPLWLYPGFGLILTALYTASLNWILCLVVALYFRLSLIFHLLLWIVGLILLALLINQEWLINTLQSVYVTGGF